MWNDSTEGDKTMRGRPMVHLAEGGTTLHGLYNWNIDWLLVCLEMDGLIDD